MEWMNINLFTLYATQYIEYYTGLFSNTKQGYQCRKTTTYTYVESLLLPASYLRVQMENWTGPTFTSVTWLRLDCKRLMHNSFAALIKRGPPLVHLSMHFGKQAFTCDQTSLLEHLKPLFVRNLPLAFMLWLGLNGWQCNVCAAHGNSLYCYSWTCHCFTR